MSIRKKHIIIFVVFIVSILLKPNLSLAEFIDSKENPIFVESINYVESENIFNGYLDGSFKPNKNINRAEFIKIIIEATQNKIEGENCFKDVLNEWYAKYVCTAKNNNIINGYLDGTFRADQNINFSEAAKIILLAYKKDIINYNDLRNWYEPYLLTLIDLDSIPSTIFQPDHWLTRAESADIIYRLNRSKKDSTEINKLRNRYSNKFESEYKRQNNNEIHYSGSTIKGVDFYSFEILNQGYVSYAKDKNKVYYEGVKILDADPNTFELKQPSINLYESCQNESIACPLFGFIESGTFAKDKNNIFINGEKLDKPIDVNTFEMIGSQTGITYYRDKKYAYIDTTGKGSSEREFRPIDESDGETFKIVDLKSLMAKDKNHVYWRDEKIEIIDADTIEVLNPQKPQIINVIDRYIEKKVKLLNPKSHYTYLKDKNHIYGSMGFVPPSPIEGVDLNSFRAVEDNDFYNAEDLNHQYKNGKLVQ